MVLPLRETRTLRAELLTFARECAWLELAELSEIETLAPHMTDDECRDLLASLQMEARLRGAPEEGDVSSR
jgi:hypothetical protein